jgi:hypothetical protein
MQRMGPILVAALVLSLGAGASNASAARMLRIYEPMQPELTIPAPVRLEDLTYQNPEVEGGFVFEVGSVRNKISEAECSGGFEGELESNNENKDTVRLTSGFVGMEGECEGQFGTPRVTLGGFPLILTLGSSGKSKVTGSLEVAIEAGAGIPASCVYKGKLVVTGKIPTVDALTLNMKGNLNSPTKTCEHMYFKTTEPESGPIDAYGAHEALWASPF